MPCYVPEKGDYVAVTFDPQAEHEQKRQATGLAVVCPVTNTNRGIPFHVAIPKESSLFCAELGRPYDCLFYRNNIYSPESERIVV